MEKKNLKKETIVKENIKKKRTEKELLKTEKSEKKANGKERNIWLLGFVSLINDTASKIVEALLPLFIIALGGSGLTVGLISGTSDSIAALFTVFSGYLSDKLRKRKIFVFWGYLAAAIGKIGLAFSTIWSHVFVLKSLERIGKGVRSAPRDAIIASSTKKEQRGKWFGIHRAFDSGGSVLGSLLALILFWYLGMSFKILFIIAGILGICSLIPLFWVKETKSKFKLIKSVKPIAQKINFKSCLKCFSPELKSFLFISGLFALGNFSYMFFVLKVKDFVSGSLLVGGPIIFYIIYLFSFTLLSVPAGMLSDKIGRKKVLMFGYALFAFICLGFMLVTQIWQGIILFLLYGMMFALVEGTERAYVADLSQPKIRGTALGTHYLLTSLALLPGGIAAGYLWDVNKMFTFGFGALMSLIALVLFLITIKKKHPVGKISPS